MSARASETGLMMMSFICSIYSRLALKLQRPGLLSFFLFFSFCSSVHVWDGSALEII